MSSKNNNYGVVFDTYAWIDYISGGRYAKKVSDLLEDSQNQKVTPATVMAELTERLLREGIDQSKIEQILYFVKSRTKVYPCDPDVAFRAGQINFQEKKKAKDWGMLDSLNYAVARILDYSFVTGDPHFKSKNDVIFLA